MIRLLRGEGLKLSEAIIICLELFVKAIQNNNTFNVTLMISILTKPSSAWNATMEKGGYFVKLLGLLQCYSLYYN